MFLYHNILALANFSAGAYDEAAKWARASDVASPRFTANLRTLIAALSAAGADREARAAAARLLELEPEFSLRRYEQTLLSFRDPVVRAQFLAALRAAGLPD